MIAPVLALATAVSATALPPVRLALIIAYNQSRDEGVPALRYADDDGARFYELLVGLGFEATLLSVFDAETAELHPEAARVARPPAWERLARSVDALRQRVEQAHADGREAELIITYSGHGAVGPRGDPYVSLLDRRLFRGDFFREVATGTGADFVHVIVDACRARDFVDARGGPDGPDFRRELSLFLASERRVQHPEVGVVVAESADGETHEWSRTRSGIFAHEVVSALAGGADINGDGAIEYSELHAFVAAANHAISDPRARLRVVAQGPAVDPRRPLLVLSSANLERVRTPSAGGRFTIEDERGVRWVDVNLEVGHQETLYLPQRSRYYVIDVSRGREAVVRPAAGGAPVALADVAFAEDGRPASRGSVAAALASDLFRTPYGPAFYRGFVVAMRYPDVMLATSVEHAAPSSSSEDAGNGAEPTGEEVLALGSPSAEKKRGQSFAASGPALPLLFPLPPSAALAKQPMAVAGSAASDPWPTHKVVRYVSGYGAVGAASLAVFFGWLAIEAKDSGNVPQVDYPEYYASHVKSRAQAANILWGTALLGTSVWAITYLFDE